MQHYTTYWERRRRQRRTPQVNPLMAGELYEWRRQGRIAHLKVIGLVLLLAGGIAVIPLRATLWPTTPSPHAEEARIDTIEVTGLQNTDVPAPTIPEPVPESAPPRIEWRAPTDTMAVTQYRIQPRTRQRKAIRPPRTVSVPEIPAIPVVVTPQEDVIYKYEISPGRTYRYDRQPPVGSDYREGPVPAGAFLITHP